MRKESDLKPSDVECVKKAVREATGDGTAGTARGGLAAQGCACWGQGRYADEGAFSVHCIAHLDQDIGEALPYLNADLGGFAYLRTPPAVTFRGEGRIITVQAREVAVNTLKDEAEADKILEWLRGEINKTWDQREGLRPSYEGAPKPKILELLRSLPKTDCNRCGQPACKVFASLVAQGVKGPRDCPELDAEGTERLSAYMGNFNLEA